MGEQEDKRKHLVREAEHVAMAERKEKKHIVMFPYMAQGHFIPFLTLAKMLTSQGLTVTFITTTAAAPKLQSHALGYSIHFLPLSFPPIPGFPPGCETTDALSPYNAVFLFVSSHNLSHAFEEWLDKVMVESSGKPSCIIADVFLPWTAQSASKFGIPRVVFHTTGAMAASVQQFLFTTPEISDIIGDRQTIEIHDLCMKNVRLRRAELPHMLRSENAFPGFPDVLPGLQQIYALGKQSSVATLVNTFDGLEDEYVKYLEESTGKPVWCVASPDFLKYQFGVDDESDECIRWLDTQREKSVLYISFGSQYFLSEEQSKALGRGIACSNEAFIWSMKNPGGSNVNSSDVLPEGFTEATKNRGMVIHGWVPQRLILSHPSTAVFMSHCGWNSTLESLSSGVPMVAWPFGMDQFLNAKLVVDQLRVGMRMCEGFDAIPSSDVVEKTVKAAMKGEIGQEMRQRTAQVKATLNEAKPKIESFASYVLNLRSDEAK